jgi:hypothetical protein
VSPLAADQLRLLRALHQHGVDFVVVGGVAAQLHGWEGATADLDIAVSRDATNVERLNRALASVGAGKGVVGGLGTAFKTTYGRLEIVRRADGVGEYADWLRNADTHQIQADLTVVVAARDDLCARRRRRAGRRTARRCHRCARTSESATGRAASRPTACG